MWCFGNACITVLHSASKDHMKNPRSSLCITTTKVENLLGDGMSFMCMQMKLKENISASASCGNTQGCSAIAVFDHLRLDKIPEEYILQRYTKNVVKDPSFNRRDYRATAADGTSLEYKRTILYNKAMKTVNRGCPSNHMFDMALSAFREVNSRMDSDEIDINNSTQSTPNEDTPIEMAGSGEDPAIEDTAPVDPYADIQPPPMAKTKGSKNKTAVLDTGKKGASVAPRPQPELDADGLPKGQRLCSNCNKIAGHNAITCKKRQLAQKLLEAHQKVYGPTTSQENVKVSIKNLLAKQSLGKEDEEEVLDTDEDEEYETHIEEEGEEEEEEDEEEEVEDQGDSEDLIRHGSNPTDSAEQNCTKEVPNSRARADNKLKNVTIPIGQRICSICHEKAGYNSRTCHKKLEILQQQVLAR